MADPVLKFPPEQKGKSDKPGAKLAAEPSRRLLAGLRRYRRFLLLVVLPIVAVIGGFVFYLNGGRYVGTDDAYVGAQKVLITPDVAGKIIKIVVKEGQHVNEGDVLFEIDPEPYQLARDQAKSALEQARTSYNNLQANIKIYQQMADLMQQSTDLKQRDVERKSTLAKSSFGSQLDLDNASNALVTARAELAFVQQQISNAKTQLLGNVELPIEQFPPYYQAKAALGVAQRNLDHTVLRAPLSGIATQVDQIQMGRYVPAGTPVTSIIPGSTPIRRRVTSPMSRSASRSRLMSMHFRTTRSRATSARCLQAPARSSRSCRRRTRPAISSRWCSGCPCVSISMSMIPW
jgi:membrane fusion protein, multidrug efflux system